MELRQYQINVISDAREAFKQGYRSICIVLPCRAGKSVIAANIAKASTDKENRVLFIVHRKELCAQIEQTFKQCGVNMWLCTVGMVQTITRRLDKMQPPDLIITDEFHHGISRSYRNIYDRYPRAYKLGFTATPIRLKEKGLGEICEKLIVGVEAQWLIENNFMSDYDYFNNKLVSTDGLHTVAGDYNKKEIDTLMDDKVVFVGAVENYLKYANGKAAIVYCTDVANSKSTADEFTAAGISAGYINGSQSTMERQRAMLDFKLGRIKILTSCEVISEGIDIADCECCILLRPTKSLSLFIQQSMRCLTYKPGKRAVILDLVGNYSLHGTPTQSRSWTLDGIEKNKILTRECEECFFVYPKKERICPKCGHIPTATQRSFEKEEAEKEKIQAQLEAIDKSVRVLANYWDCKTWEEMCAFRKKKGYKWGWELHKCRELNIEIPEKYQKYEKVRASKIAQGGGNAAHERNSALSIRE